MKWIAGYFVRSYHFAHPLDRLPFHTLGLFVTCVTYLSLSPVPRTRTRKSECPADGSARRIHLGGQIFGPVTMIPSTSLLKSQSDWWKMLRFYLRYFTQFPFGCEEKGWFVSGVVWGDWAVAPGGGVTSLEKQPLSSFIRISLSHVRRAGKKENEKLAAPKVLLWLSRLLDNFVVK